LVPHLADSQHAVTHDLHVSFMRSIPTGARCDLCASVSRIGRTLAFLEVSAHVDGKLVATARITKSITVLKDAQ
jgi:acyl-coenzyme A thioesterase PaaI-like protein